MRRIESEFRELRWRIKGTAGLLGLGAFLGAVAWIWSDVQGEADLLTLARALAVSAEDWRFWSVLALCAALGGWLSMLLFWRSSPDDAAEDRGPGGMSGPRF